MRVAFLILAHQQPALLSRLIKRLSSETSYFFVHLDLKADLKQFKAATENFSHITFLPNSLRKRVNWGGYSIVAATLNLIHFALASGVGFSRFCLLSGNDYPIKSISSIMKKFDAEVEFIQIQKILNFDGNTPFEQRARKFFFGDTRFTNPRSGPHIINRAIRKAEIYVNRKFPQNVKLYYGSQWWCLTAGAIHAILSEITRRPDIIRWFHWTICPDELFFQTFLKLTKYSQNIAYDFHEFDSGPRAVFESMHYIDWFTPNPTIPKVLDLGDLEKLKNSRALFARKFDEVRSKALIAALDEF